MKQAHDTVGALATIGAMVMLPFAACSGSAARTTPLCDDAHPCIPDGDGGLDGHAADAPPEGDDGHAVDAPDGVDATIPCDTCSERLRPVVPKYFACSENGPPSSKTLLGTLASCFCKACAAQCTTTCETQPAGVPTATCFACAEASCPEQWDACVADQ
jgi:hypothetical protein